MISFRLIVQPISVAHDRDNGIELVKPVAVRTGPKIAQLPRRNVRPSALAGDSYVKQSGAADSPIECYGI